MPAPMPAKLWGPGPRVGPWTGREASCCLGRRSLGEHELDALRGRPHLVQVGGLELLHDVVWYVEGCGQPPDRGALAARELAVRAAGADRVEHDRAPRPVHDVRPGDDADDVVRGVVLVELRQEAVGRSLRGEV